MLIGHKLRELRVRRKLTLEELSKKSGVQLATLSRIENLKMVGSLESHLNIAKALNIEVTELYSELVSPKDKAEVESPKSTSEIFTHSDKASYEILTKNVFNKKMMPVMMRIESGGKTQMEKSDLGTEKFLFVLEGEIKVSVADETFRLQKHNTLYFDAALPHSYTNGGKTNARMLVIGTPSSL